MSILVKGNAASLQNEKCDLVLKNAKFINVFTEEYSYGDIGIIDNIIIGIGKYHGIKEIDCTGKVVAPGFVDCHVHIESSMVTPRIYGDIALRNGVTTVIADPHEIANILGSNGIDFMISESELTPLDIYFMIPSCVPATKYEENGYTLNADDVKKYLNNKNILGLGEVMDVPAVINMESSMIEKLTLFKDKIIDGHSPHASGEILNQYILSGIKTDHECSTHEEALEKISLGMYVLIREGSAAKNLRDLIGCINEKNFRRFALCTDDRHVEDILETGTINNAVRLAIELGMDPIKAYIMGTSNGYSCYGLKNKGAVAPGYIADLIILDDLEKVSIETTIKSGKQYEGKIMDEKIKPFKNSMNMSKVTMETFKIKREGSKVNVIEVIPYSLETNQLVLNVIGGDEFLSMSQYDDVLKVGVFERHKGTNHFGLGFLKGMGFKNCSVAQSIAHDSHNVIVIGDNDEDMVIAVNELIAIGGGIVIASKGHIVDSLSLEIGGVMTYSSMDVVYERVKKLNESAKGFGLEEGIDPFITLSFMSLPVIPNIKITSKGIFSYEIFNFIPLIFN